MEDILNNSTQPVAAQPAAQPIAAQPAAQPSYTVTPSSSSESSGGGDGFLDVLKGLNWIEIGIGMVGVYVLFSAAAYFRNNNKSLHPSLTDMQNKIDKITIELSDVKTALEKESLKPVTKSTQVFI